MNQRQKQYERFLTFPKDYDFAELKRLLESFGYEQRNKGKTSGSRVIFTQEGKPAITFHRPHPPKKPVDQNVLKEVATIIELDLQGGRRV